MPVSFGSHLSPALVARGGTVRVVDDLSTGLIGNVPAGAEFVAGDLAASRDANINAMVNRLGARRLNFRRDAVP